MMGFLLIFINMRILKSIRSPLIWVLMAIEISVEKAIGISPVEGRCCVVKRMIWYNVLSCKDDHHRRYNHHDEDLTVSPVAGRGNVGWRPCGETRPNWIYRQHHLRHTRWRHQCQRLLSKSRSCVINFCPSSTVSTLIWRQPHTFHHHGVLIITKLTIS